MLLLHVLSQVTSNSSLPKFCTVCVLLNVYCCIGVSFVCLFGFNGGFVFPWTFSKLSVAPSAVPGQEQEVPGWDARCQRGATHNAWSPLLFHCSGIGLSQHRSTVLRSYPTNLFLNPPALNFELPCSPSPQRGWNASAGSAGLGFSLQINPVP